MIINVNNGSSKPNMQFDGIYCNATADEDGYIALKTGNCMKAKLSIADVPFSSHKVAAASIRMAAKEPTRSAAISIYESSEDDFNNGYTSILGTRIDTVSFEGKSAPYGQAEIVIEFDISKYLRAKLDGKSAADLYFKIVVDKGSVEVKEINREDPDSQVAAQMQLAQISGLDSMYEYAQNEAGYAGVSSVNIATGELIHKFEAIGTPSEKAPITLDFFYSNGKWKANSEYEMNKVNDNTYDIVEPSGKTTRYYKCEADDIEDNYDMDPIEDIEGTYFLSFSDATYLLVGNDGNKAILVDKKGNKMIFEKSGSNFKVAKLELENGKTVTYTLGSSGPTSIRNSEGERLDISYSNRQVSTARAYDCNGTLIAKTTFAWDVGSLKYAYGYIGTSSSIVKEAAFTYDSSGRLLTAEDAKGGIHEKIGYEGSGRVHKTECGTSSTGNPFSTFDYNGMKTRVTDYTGRYVDYFFDGYGRCKVMIDDEAKSITRNYGGVIDGKLGGLTSESKVQVNERNVIDNSSFETEETLFGENAAWKLSSGSRDGIKVVDGGVYGQKCLRIEKGASDVKINQYVSTPVPGTYAFRAFIKGMKTTGAINAGDIKVQLEVKYTKKTTISGSSGGSKTKSGKTNGGGSTVTKEVWMTDVYTLQNDFSGNFDWVEANNRSIFIPDTSGNTYKHLSVYVSISLSGSGYTAFVDDIQLCRGDHQIRHNYIVDGWFETGGNHPWETSNCGALDGIGLIYDAYAYQGFLGQRAMKFSGDITKEKSAKREIEIHGGAGDELLLTCFGKGTTSSNDRFGVSVKIHYVDTGTTSEHSFDFDPNFDSWQVLTRSIVAERAYDKITVTLFSRSANDVWFEAVQLYRDSFGKQYTYNEKKDMTQMVNADGTTAEVSYDKNERVTEATDESGDSYRYSFNEDGTVSQIANNQNTKVQFKYSNGCKAETKVVSSAGDVLKTSSTYDDRKNVLSETDDDGNVTRYEYDSLGRKIKTTSANGTTTTYTYNSAGELSKQLQSLNGTSSSCQYEYDVNGNVAKITTGSGTVYRFEYDGAQKIKRVTLDGKAIVSNEYGKSVGGVNTGLPTRQTLGQDDTCGYYDFGYDGKLRLSYVNFNGIRQAEYTYDEFDRPTCVYDAVNKCREYIDYDSDGNVANRKAVWEDGTSEHGDDSFHYFTDNLKNLQRIDETVFGIRRGIDFEYKCEYNDYTPSGYLARLARAFPDEIIKGGSGLKGMYGGRPILNTTYTESINVDDDSPLGDTVQSLSFKSDNATVIYDIDTLDSTRKPESTISNRFSYSAWKADMTFRRSAFGWIKPSGTIAGQQKIFTYASKIYKAERLTLIAEKDGTISIYDYSAGKSPILTSNGKLSMGAWNLVGMKFAKSGDRIYAMLVLNGEVKSADYACSKDFKVLKYFHIGEPSQSLSLMDLYKLDDGGSLKKEYPINMAFRLAFAGVGSYDYEEDDYKGIYEEGKKYLLGEPIYGASGVTWSNAKVYEGMDVISLNGSLVSLSRMQPKEFSYTEASFKVDKSRAFEFDQEERRHVYGSYGSLVNLNRGNPSKLAYDLLLKDEGTITMRFKPKGSVSGKRFLLSAGKGTKVLKAFLEAGKLRIESGSQQFTLEGVSVGSDSWHRLAVRWDGKSVKIDLDGNSGSFAFSNAIDLDGCLTYVGCDVDGYGKPIDHLEGCIEMLAFSDRPIDDERVSAIAEEGCAVSVRTYYDELGRTASKEIVTDGAVLEKAYSYKRSFGLTTTKVEKETNFLGHEIAYGYDKLGSISAVSYRKAGSDNATLPADKTYTYDGLGRLVSSNHGGIAHSYAYDANNNITSKDGMIYGYDASIKDRLVSRSDGTTIEYGDSFVGNPTRIKKPSLDIRMSWSGRRLKSANGTTYEYNAEGIRTAKRSGSCDEFYSIEGGRIAAMKRVEGGDEKIVLFNYDEANQLIGFTYGDKEYFYERNLMGDIASVIDAKGHSYVSYDYDDWGAPEVHVDDSSAGKEIARLNHFMFRGYFHDDETGFYYLKTRYYDPDLGRFISMDSQIGKIGETMGMNLFAYCSCNPVGMTDENGQWGSWFTKLMIGIAVIAVCAVAVAVTVATCGAGSAAACIATSAAVGALKGAAIGAAVGAVTGAVQGAITEGIRTGTWEGALRGAFTGAIEGAADGFMWGAIGGAISGAMNPSYCFVAGTLVATSLGMKAIDEIRQGDKVLSYDENLGIYDEKEVLDVYVNETAEVVHLFIGNDEIICTPGHRFLTEEGWEPASELKKGDCLRAKDGFDLIKDVEREKLAAPIKTYNLNVQGFHTYLVSAIFLLVHNACNKLAKNLKKAGIQKQPGQDAHHIFPQQFKNDFLQWIDSIDDAKYGIWMNQSPHRAGAAAYNKLWFNAINSGKIKTVDDLWPLAQEFMQTVYHMII